MNAKMALTVTFLLADVMFAIGLLGLFGMALGDIPGGDGAWVMLLLVVAGMWIINVCWRAKYDSGT